MRRLAILLPLISGLLSAQVTYERLAAAAKEPQNWLTYSGGYASQRYSTLEAITPRNVKTLEQKWVFQAESLQKFEASPLVIDGVMYLTQPPNDVVAHRCPHGPHLLALPVQARARFQSMLRRREPRTRDSRRYPVHGNCRCPPDRHRRAQRQARCGTPRWPTMKPATP